MEVDKELALYLATLVDFLPLNLNQGELDVTNLIYIMIHNLQNWRPMTHVLNRYKYPSQAGVRIV